VRVKLLVKFGLFEAGKYTEKHTHNSRNHVCFHCVDPVFQVIFVLPGILADGLFAFFDEAILFGEFGWQISYCRILYGVSFRHMEEGRKVALKTPLACLGGLQKKRKSPRS
jgi:hypothetical protein